MSEESCEWLLLQTLQAGMKLGVLRTRFLDKEVVDIICSKEAIEHPVNSNLFTCMRKVSDKLGPSWAA
jgi:hypothetical protein